MSVRRLGAVLAAAAVPAVVLTGCATTQTAGRPATGGIESACSQTGSSAAAAGATVHCYLGALSTLDTKTACSVLSAHVRSVIADAAGDGTDYDSAVHVPAGGSTGAIDSGCSTVAPAMQRALGQLPVAELQQFRSALAGARVGDAQLSSGRATVSVTLTVNARSGTQDVELIQDGGRWKIDSANAFSINS